MKKKKISQFSILFDFLQNFPLKEFLTKFHSVRKLISLINLNYPFSLP